MIIDASEIGNHCNHGWRAVFQFQDGRVQIEYDGEDAYNYLLSPPNFKY
jgi:hypothetical protein